MSILLIVVPICIHWPNHMLLSGEYTHGEYMPMGQTDRQMVARTLHYAFCWTRPT